MENEKPNQSLPCKPNALNTLGRYYLQSIFSADQVDDIVYHINEWNCVDNFKYYYNDCKCYNAYDLPI